MTDDAAPIYDDKAELRGSLDLTGARWQSSDGAVAGEDDFEVAPVLHTDGVTYMAVRKATEPDRLVLVFTPAEWDAFVKGAKHGEFEGRW
ncbi:DUF397 domain-containing protein [Kutzneria sp. NPDC052558]|uniref:DUF397 domain-containing protein n=1 Tax=Kutzneria sp. NPDC052558 TaxID=3364121 RepID=UPI0037CC99C4